MSTYEFAAGLDADHERPDVILKSPADDLTSATDAERVYLARLAVWETEGGQIRAP